MKAKYDNDGLPNLSPEQEAELTSVVNELEAHLASNQNSLSQAQKDQLAELISGIRDELGTN